LTSSPSIADNLIVVGDAEGVLYAVDSISGEPRWSVFAGSYLSSPTLDDGLVVVGTDGGYLLALTDRTA
ncbi:MAG: PQQ-binding-like beta-propeller repeat protein, partial [Thermomicrobiales bacterium]|nr:PQQ-binding-like beta-propeller repeat protein [Thermomicrobiales bacterium]